jgi:Zn-finger nucleic acid-binding protein
MSERVACPGCGAEIPATGVCRFCGATALVDGVAGRLLPSDLKCPRCAGKPPLQGVEHDGFRVDFCRRCHGAWFGLGMLEEVIRTAVKRALKKGEGDEGPVHFAQTPLVIIDRCPSHGDWCDGGELAQLKAVARTRGVDEALGHAEQSRAARTQAQKEAGQRAMDGFGQDPLIAELRKRPGNWGIVPPEVGAIDAYDRRQRSPLDPFGGKRRRRRGGDLFDMLWVLIRDL